MDRPTDGKNAQRRNGSGRRGRPRQGDRQSDFGYARILIVDDNEPLIGLLRRYSEKLDAADVFEAHDGEQALEILDSNAIDCVLCDLEMPGMDGIEFLRHLAEREASPTVVLLSGHDMSILSTAVRLGRAHGLRIVGSLSKPFTFAALRELLAQSAPASNSGPRLSFQPLTPDALHYGLDNDAVELAFQPKVSIGANEVTGVETLLRWRDRSGDLVNPASVVPVAEQHNLMNKLTEIVVRKALAQHGNWLADGHNFSLAINVSLLDLYQYDFPEFVLDTASSAGVPPSLITLEVTETQIMADIARPLETLSRLRLKGVALAIDDFGTGASVLQQLKRIPFTELKIDREFVSGAPEDKATRTMQASIIRLAKNLKLGIVAEGVETESELRLVAARRVDAVQGYYIVRPMPAADLPGWIADTKSAKGRVLGGE
ncbi:EAL domain-containing response regulator [Pelagibius marinus]|uniref:EAL domain-containing response regulator n=1 Tax=Pelagibius marinus TaxID=2762760 RepID=UPI001872FADF|nr:EAL domain-containing response regulator [Pelagibius marinus]